MNVKYGMNAINHVQTLTDHTLVFVAQILNLKKWDTVNTKQVSYII
jgi:hypothetical protein